MTRNTKEVSLIQHRSGNLAEMPRALHQAELGLAKDANRLFIGNEANTILANREKFPYQNLEILTEYSDLRDHFRYTYENNIQHVKDSSVDRGELKEFMPIVVTCKTAIPSSGISLGGELRINSQLVEIATGDTAEIIVKKINIVSKDTLAYATVIPTAVGGSMSTTDFILTIVCMHNELVVDDADSSGILTRLGFPTDLTYDVSMPERKVTEKLDDTLNISDFKIAGDGIENSSQKIYNALTEVYRNYADSQFYRDVMFPAGTYVYSPAEVTASDTIKTYAPFPMISNLHVHGEGIDRTIISGTRDFSAILLNGVDDNLNPESSASYGKGYRNEDNNGVTEIVEYPTYPENILIEDMTFESAFTSSGSADAVPLCRISGINNITFNRVKFKGSGIRLVHIVGTASKYASNITFNECIFENGLEGIIVEKFAENITITNCLFNNISSSAVKLGIDESVSLASVIRAVNMNGNILKNTPSTTGSNTYGIEIHRNATYCSIHQTQFEDRLFNNWKLNAFPQPFYNSTENATAYNFIDTLDPREDELKVLRFKFAQPTWEYIDYLINQQGNKVLVVDGQDSDVATPNGLNIKESANGLDIRAVGTDAGDVTLSVENDSDITIGAGLDTTSPVTGNIQIQKTIQLNDNIISNETAGGDVVIKTATDKVIKVDETGDTPYETLISDEGDALTNVNYVKRQIIDTYEHIVTYKDLDDMEDGMLPLITFDPIIYGENVHLKRITITTRVPFYKSFEDISKAVDYKENYCYYAGDVVKTTTSGNDTYAVVINSHVASSASLVSNANVQIIPNQPTYKSVKYVNIFDGANNYNLTRNYHEIYNDLTLNDYDYVNIQRNNRFGYVSCPEFVDNTTLSGDDAFIFDYCGRNYVINPDGTSQLYKISDLHDPEKVSRKHDEGYIYTFEMDRDIMTDVISSNNPATLNYSGNSLKLAFYNEDKTQITSFDDDAQLNPGGKLLIRVEFLREEVTGYEPPVSQSEPLP